MPAAKTPAAAAADIPATAPAPAHRPMPRMGETVMVQLVPGRQLINNESGGFFTAEATPQTVTTTLLRRIADGDLTLL